MNNKTINIQMSETISIDVEKKMLKTKFTLCIMMINALAKEIEDLKVKVNKIDVDK